MKKFTETIEKKVKEKIEYHVANCIKCNNNVITDKGDTDLKKHKPIMLFNNLKYDLTREFGAICHKCNSKYTEYSKDRGEFKYEAAAIWNKYNDIDALIAQQQVNIKVANDEIERLVKANKTDF